MTNIMPSSINLYDSKQKALDAGGVLLCNKKLTKYFWQNSYKEFMEMIKKSPIKDFYEHINTKQPVNCFIDIDIKKGVILFEKHEQVLTDTLETLNNLFRDLKKKYIILESHGINKKSYHIILRMSDKNGNNIYFENVNYLKNILSEVKDIDFKVYRDGLFRTIYSSKNGENRPLLKNKLSDEFDDIESLVGYTQEPFLLMETKLIKTTPKKASKEKVNLVSYKKANALLDRPEDTVWELVKYDKGTKAVPNCRQCLIDPTKQHTHDNHSALFINNDKSVIKSCFSCGSEVMSKSDSKKVINVFNVIMNVANHENSVYQELVKDLLKTAIENNYRREKNTGIVYKQVKPYAYVKYLEPMDFLNEIFLGDLDFKSNVNNMDNMIKFMKQYNDPDFPFLEYDKEYIGFKNGIYNYVDCEFTHENDNLSNVVVKKYIDQEFTGTMDTPLLDKVLDYQFDPEVRDFLYTCIGRMFKIRDNFEFFIFLLGEPGCGKSVILDAISACFSDVGVFSKTFEPKYGLSYLYNKDIVVCDDLPENFHELLGQDLFQSIVSNSKVSTAVKNGDAIQIESWKNAWILASNYMVKYKDKGQISRRTLTWKYEKNVYEQDPTIMENIKNNELPQFIYKCTSAYKELLKQKTKSIWKLCPEYFLEQQEELKIERNPLYKFLLENTRYKQDNVMLMDDIRKKFNEWLQKNVRSLDNGTFGQVNREYVVEAKKVCKHCDKEAKKGCCEKYNNKDRTRRTMVKNLEFIPSDLHEELY